MDDVAFSDWADSVDISGSNHWLPAYGYQQPMQDGDVNDGAALLVSSLQPPFVFLETIMEETSDDLRSESDRSGHAGWLDSDSENDSVIHVPAAHGRRDVDEDDAKAWSGSERDLAVPKKRRRRTDDEDDESTSLSSRSSSLLQFECLEKHCDDVFHTSATADPFQGAGPKMDSDYGFGYLASSNRWRFSDSSDSLDEPTEENSSSSDEASSDDTMLHSSWSSRGSYQQNRSLRSYRSFDSLNILQYKQQLSLAELSQSLTNEDFILTQYDAFDSSLVVATADLSKLGAEVEHVVVRVDVEAEDVTPHPSTVVGKTQRSAENLSEDSGFGDHVPKLSSLHGRIRSATIIEDEDDSFYYSSGSSGDDEKSLKLAESEFAIGERRGWHHNDDEAKFNTSCWQSAPNLATLLADLRGGEAVSESPIATKCGPRRDDDVLTAATTTTTTCIMAGSLPVLEHRVPLKHFSIDEDELEKEATSKSLSAVRGVTFCPVVSEVSWRESYSEEEPEVDSPDAEDYERDFEEDVDEEDDKDSSDDDDEDDDDEDDEEDGDDEVLVSKIDIGTVDPREVDQVRVDPLKANSHVNVAVQSSPPTVPSSHVVLLSSRTIDTESVSAPVSTAPLMDTHASESGSKKSSRFGSFFTRFSFRRRHPDQRKEEKKKPKQQTEFPAYEDVTIISLHPPPKPDVVISSKPPLPPLPPRVVGASVKAPASRRWLPPTQGQNVSRSMSGEQAATPRCHPPRGLLETDLDTEVTITAQRPPHQTNVPPKKARSLLNLGMNQGLSVHNGHLKPTTVETSGHRPLHGHGGSVDARAKSMEFLLDKENQAAVQPPENELQKGSGCAGGDRVMSEHQLRVQRSLQKLNVPDWYKNSAVATRGHEGFLLRKDASPREATHQGWPGLGSKTTSLSSLGSTQSAAARSPTSHLLSPSPTPGTQHVFTRWSTNRLNSGGTSASTSPCNSTRSSFNYRQPYLGWRSQERLAHPRTPAERLAAGILPQQTQQEQQVPNLTEVRTSIKEVTSAIVHYVSGVRDGSGELPTLPPASRELETSRDQWTRSSSPRGSGRLCWLESSFVGSRPLETPDTPVTITNEKLGNELGGAQDLYLDLSNTKQKQQQHFNTRHVNAKGTLF